MTTTPSLESLLDGPPRHLERFAPPWAAGRRTICGRPLDDVATWLTFAESKALIEKIGANRARLVLCQTCLSSQRAIATAAKWNANPAQVVHDWSGKGTWPAAPGAEDIRYELLALARLVEAHRAEYDALVAGYKADEITARRKARATGGPRSKFAPIETTPRPL